MRGPMDAKTPTTRFAALSSVPPQRLAGAIMTQLRIFVLKAREDLPNTDNPFRPWYDKTFGVVVRAGSEDSARCLVSEELGPTEGRDVWMLPHYTECLELTGCGESEIILTDFRSA